MIKLSFTENRELSEKRKECLEWLGKHRVEVGLTSKASGRSRFLLGIHTRGSPVMRIPPRPVVQPALAQEDLREEMAGCLAEACGAEPVQAIGSKFVLYRRRRKNPGISLQG